MASASSFEQTPEILSKFPLHADAALSFHQPLPAGCLQHTSTSLRDFTMTEEQATREFSNMRFRGFHILLDYTGVCVQDPQELSDWLREVVLKSLSDNRIRCVSDKSVVFPEEDRHISPPGFTSLYLLDESHVSGHCYSEIGMLALDVFTCGGKPQQTYAAARNIHNAVMARFPHSDFIGSRTHRFPCGGASEAKH